MQLISWGFFKKMFPCQMSFRTGFVVTVVLDDCLLFGYCSYSQFTQGNRLSPFPRPTLLNLFYQVWSVPLPLCSLCRCFSQRCSAASQWPHWAKSSPAGLNRAVRRINQGPQFGRLVLLLRSNGFCEDTLAQYLTNAWVPSLGCSWWHVTVGKAALPLVPLWKLCVYFECSN